MITVDLMKAIQDLHPNSSVSVNVYRDFCVVSVVGLPTSSYPVRDEGAEWPNSYSVSWHEDQAILAVRRYDDRDIDAALETAWSLLTELAVSA